MLLLRTISDTHTTKESGLRPGIPAGLTNLQSLSESTYELNIKFQQAFQRFDDDPFRIGFRTTLDVATIDAVCGLLRANGDIYYFLKSLLPFWLHNLVDCCVAVLNKHALLSHMRQHTESTLTQSSPILSGNYSHHSISRVMRKTPIVAVLSAVQEHNVMGWRKEVGVHPLSPQGDHPWFEKA